jgi:acetyl esterase/lipase
MHPRRLLPLLLLLCLPLGAHADITRDVIYGHKDGMALVLDVYRPDGNANGAGVAYMISGGWMSSEGMQQAYETMFVPLVDAGFTVFAIRHGSGPRYKVPEAWSDVSQAFQFVGSHARDYGVDPQRIGVSGISAGGHLSLMLGLNDHTANGEAAGFRPAAVVAYMPPTDLRGMAGPSDRFGALEFDSTQETAVSPIDYVSSDDPPVLLVHGNADELVPIRHSERMLAALKQANVKSELVVIDGAPHGLFTGEGEQTAAQALLGWFQENL